MDKNIYFLLGFLVILYACASKKTSNEHLLNMKTYKRSLIVEYNNKCTIGDMKACHDEVTAYYYAGEIESAYKMATERCQQNIKVGCASLGSLYFKDMNLIKSQEFYQLACKNKEEHGCEMYATFLKAEEKNQEWVNVLDRACLNNSAGGCYFLNYHYNSNNEKEKASHYKKILQNKCLQEGKELVCQFYASSVAREDTPKALKIYKNICEKGNKSACAWALVLDKKKNDKEMMEAYKKGCETYDEDSMCQDFAGYQYNIGNKELANRYYRKACQIRVSNCEYLGRVEYFKKNNTLAKEYFKLACGLWVADACFNMGIVLNEEKNQDEAKKYLEVGCLLNHPKSCVVLGSLWAEKNEIEAEKYIAKACKLGNAEGCYSLGVKQHKKENKKMAEEHFIKSCDKDFSQGCQGKCLIEAENDQLDSARNSISKACELTDNEGAFCSSLKSNPKNLSALDKDDLLNKCSYDRKKPWWFWAAVIGAGVLTGRAIN